jgi:hypothetical protein
MEVESPLTIHIFSWVFNSVGSHTFGRSDPRYFNDTNMATVRTSDVDVHMDTVKRRTIKLSVKRVLLLRN